MSSLLTGRPGYGILHRNIEIFRFFGEEPMPDLVQVFKALANEHRLAIFTLLRDACCLIEPEEEAFPTPLADNALTVNDIVAHLRISQATVSHHLKELAQAGLLVRRKVGQNVYYLINTDTVDAIKTFFALASTRRNHS
ncbi:MAG: ArsR family transcriptional regulator [Nitrospinota bacterium]|nr:MAG: ArsR family transcriptional regulator [Nitrospinota bacterium]